MNTLPRLSYSRRICFLVVQYDSFEGSLTLVRQQSWGAIPAAARKCMPYEGKADQAVGQSRVATKRTWSKGPSHYWTVSCRGDSVPARHELKMRLYNFSCRPTHKSITGTLCPASSTLRCHPSSTKPLILSCSSALASRACAWYGPITLARTAALMTVRACEKRNRYAASCSGMARMRVIKPQSGA